MSGAVPPPAARPLGRAGSTTRVSRVRSLWASGPSTHRRHSARSCEPLLGTVGMAGGRPWGGCLVPL